MPPARHVHVTMMVAAVMLMVVPAPALAAHDVTSARVEGDDRFDTAARLAQLQFPDGAATAVVATGEGFADALAGTALTGAVDAPMLLVEREAVPEATEAALADLGVENIYLLGGTDAIGPEVEAQLADGRDLARLQGADRHATAAAVAREVARLEASLGEIAGLTTAYIATGEGFADALAAGSLAVMQPDTSPILLVDRDRYPDATARAIDDLGIEMAIVIGGPDAVSPQVEAGLDEDTRSLVRLEGDDRHATAVAVADFAMREFGITGELSLLARSDTFPDALAAGLHAGRNRAPILLTPPGTLDAATHDWLHDLCPTIDVVRAVGGPRAISAATLDTAVTHARHCHAAEDQTGESYRVEPTTTVSVGPDTSVDLSARERYDDRPVQQPLDVALFPCAAYDRSTGTFADADGDGFADGVGTTTTGAARITFASESERVEDGYAHELRSLHGAFAWRLHAGAEDCALNVLFDDVGADDQLAVDDQGHPLEHHGLRQVRWTAD